MSVNERIRVLRKHLGLSQVDFGSRVGIKQGHMTNIETGRREVTDKTIKVICSTFGVCEDWLRGGTGEMLSPRSEDVFASLAAVYDLNNIDRRILSAYLKLPPRYRDALQHFLLALADGGAETELEGIQDEDTIEGQMARAEEVLRRYGIED
ncbi:MAG: helix-turn-helix domain-containing protein [Christensenellaceae bacterium]|jgi:transcriptional regulator with XRE-family HTH domain|nr:helix-turn-helix domain-containing protein [Christensenellaceae bacterium]